jgi:hypothetical protein
MSEDKLSIKYEMAQFDRKNRNFLDELTEEEQKKFSPYLMIRWGSSVGGSPDLQAYYLMSVNERLNKHFFDINTTNHKKLQWLMATTVSPGMGNQYHSWIKPAKKDSKAKPGVINFLKEVYPHYKDDEIELLVEINTEADIKDLARRHGWDEKRIKKEL